MGHIYCIDIVSHTTTTLYHTFDGTLNDLVAYNQTPSSSTTTTTLDILTSGALKP
jgi:hypothetical protein